MSSICSRLPMSWSVKESARQRIRLILHCWLVCRLHIMASFMAGLNSTSFAKGKSLIFCSMTDAMPFKFLTLPQHNFLHMALSNVVSFGNADYFSDRGCNVIFTQYIMNCLHQLIIIADIYIYLDLGHRNICCMESMSNLTSILPVARENANFLGRLTTL